MADSPKRSRARWLLEPEMLVALSAVTLGVAGLFVAAYETAIMREESRAAVWPNAEVTASLRDDIVRIHVRNTGVGPARVRSASLTHTGDVVRSWPDLMRTLGAPEDVPGTMHQSLIGGRVLPAQSEAELAFSYGAEAGDETAGALVDSLNAAIVRGDVDVTLCYCSVYDECWTSTLQHVVRQWLAIAAIPPSEEREVERCEATTVSGI